MASLGRVGSMDVVLTAGCNLRCTYCYENSKQDRRMDWSTLKGSIDLLLRSRRDSVNLTFYGGEPLLQFDLLVRAVEYIRSRRLRRPAVRYSMITNGTLLRGEVADFVAAHRIRTQISFDGVREAQDLRGRGTFRRLDGVLSSLRRRHPLFFREDVSVSVTVLGSTLRHLAASIAYFLRKGVQEITISPLVTHDPSWKAASKDELDAQFAAIFRMSARHLERRGEVPIVLFRRNEPDSVHRPLDRAMCGVGRGEALTVDVDGEVSACVMFARSYQTFSSDFLKDRFRRMELGPLRGPELAARLSRLPERTREAGIFHSKQNKRSSYARCGECRFLETCTVCPVSIGNMPGNTDPDRVPDHQCAFNLVTRAWRERFPVQATPLDQMLGRAPLPRMMRQLQEAVKGIRRASRHAAGPPAGGGA
jgi:sulfatase maturation enzyme AslB (radical SAM superfamily)